MRISFFYYLFITLIGLFVACEAQNQTRTEGATPSSKSQIQLNMFSNPFPYDLQKPDHSFALPPELNEVSGLSFYEPGILAMLQDENGFIYLFNYEKDSLIEPITFWKDADFEGIEKVGDIMYALKSDGDVFEIKGFPSQSLEVKKFETSLKKENDTEGLAYDPKDHRLLLACKASPNLDVKKHKGNRAIYEFNLNTDSLEQEPAILVNLEKLKVYFESQLPKGQNWPEEKVSFHPSALAIHPISGELYILSSAGKLLVSVDREGNIIKAFPLDAKLFKHPEGLCFLPDGTLFISNEGDEGEANLLQFLLKK